MFIADARTYLNLLSANPDFAARFLDAAVPEPDASRIRRLFPAAEMTPRVTDPDSQAVVPRQMAGALHWARAARLSRVDDVLRKRLPGRVEERRAVLRNALTGKRVPYPYQEAEAKKNFYMDRQQRREWVLTLRKGRLYDAGNKPLTGRVQYVFSPDETLYGKFYGPGQREDRSANEFHTRYLAGNPVRVGGWLRVVNSKITWLSNNSGHYRPPSSQLVPLLKYLRRNEVDLTQMDLQLVLANGKTKDVNAQQFLDARARGNRPPALAQPQPGPGPQPGPRTQPPSRSGPSVSRPGSVSRQGGPGAAVTRPGPGARTVGPGAAAPPGRGGGGGTKNPSATAKTSQGKREDKGSRPAWKK